MNDTTKKTILVVVIEITIASIFVLGADWANRSIHVLFHSYFADIVIPFGFYLLLCLSADRQGWLVQWWQRSLAVFILCTTSEILQYFGIFALAHVFDPIDIIMYGIGTLAAMFLDRYLFAKIFNFWNLHETSLTT